MNIVRNFANAVREYLVGLSRLPGFRQAIAALCAMSFALAMLVGMIDVAFSWRLPVPLWLHVIVTSVFALCVALNLHRHAKRTRAIGRDRLEQSAR